MSNLPKVTIGYPWKQNTLVPDLYEMYSLQPHIHVRIRRVAGTDANVWNVWSGEGKLDGSYLPLDEAVEVAERVWRDSLEKYIVEHDQLLKTAERLFNELPNEENNE